MTRAAQILKDWMLPIAIVTGIGAYLIYHVSPVLRPIGPFCDALASHGQRWVIAFLLFFQFVKISPHQLRLAKWHFGALAVQVGSFMACAAVLAIGNLPHSARIVLECVMLCFVCPTASAAGVVTDRLGGNLAETVTYLVIINLVATFLIPLGIPLVSPSATLGFWAYAGHLALRVFPVLVLPALVAWTIRYTTRKLQRRLMRWSSNSFYIWGVGLFLAMVMSTRALVVSGIGIWTVAAVVGVSVVCCFLQFFAGHRLNAEDRTTPGQALGQKNTGFLIWLGYNYLTPVTSVAGGLYAVWQNLFNSWELYRHSHQMRASRNTSTIEG